MENKTPLTKEQEILFNEVHTELIGCLKSAIRINGMIQKVKDKSKWSGSYLEKIKDGRVPSRTYENLQEMYGLLKFTDSMLLEHARSLYVVDAEILNTEI